MRASNVVKRISDLQIQPHNFAGEMVVHHFPPSDKDELNFGLSNKEKDRILNRVPDFLLQYRATPRFVLGRLNRLHSS